MLAPSMQPATPLSDPGPSAATGDAFGRGAAPFETHARAIVAALGGRLEASDTQALAPLVRIAALEGAGVGSVSFLAHPKYVRHLHDTRASCVILQAELLVRAQEARPQGCAFIVHEQPYLFYARLSQWWKANALAAQAVAVPRIHPSAVVHPSARVDATARIGALCVVGEGVEIGAYTELRPRVTIEPGCRVGQRCLIHSGAVIGADGFGFAPRADKSWEKIEQLGGVWIGDDVEIGANTCIDRGALSDTRIENGVKLDNLVQIGHNVTVGEHSAFAGCAGVAGSAQIGKRCTVGGGAVVLGHLSLADDVHISASTTATRSISEPGLYSGIFPVDTNRDWERNAVIVRRLSELRDRLRKLEQQPAAMPSSPPGSP